MSELAGWDYLKTLAIEYLALIEDGYSANPSERIPGQINLANQIVEGVLPFLYERARKYIKTGLEISTPNGPRVLRSRFTGPIDDFVVDEFVSAASIRLFTSLPSYRPDLYAFSTFVGYTAASAIHRAALHRTHIIDIPTNVMSANRRLLNDEATLVEKLGVNAARSLKLAVSGFYFDVNHIRGAYDPNVDFADLLPVVQEVFPELSEREQIVLKCRFGLDGDELTHKDISELLAAQGDDITRQRVEQVEKEALEKLGVKVRQKTIG